MTTTAEMLKVKMKNNSDNSLTYAQALKIYTGRNLLMSAVRSAGTAAAVIIFAAVYVYVFGLLISEKHLNAEVFDMVMIMVGSSAMIAPRILQTFTKQFPGGKFFRTVKGGFETFRKMRTALLLETILIIIFYYLLAAAGAALALLPTQFGVMSCVSGAVFTAFAAGFGNICMIIKKGIARVFAVTLIMIIVPMLGVFVNNALRGSSLIAVLVTAAIVDAALIPLSHHVMIKDYRKNHWDN